MSDPDSPDQPPSRFSRYAALGLLTGFASPSEVSPEQAASPYASDILPLVLKVGTQVLTIAIGVGFLVVIYNAIIGFFQYRTHGENQEQLDMARANLISSGVGLVIMTIMTVGLQWAVKKFSLL